MMKTLLAAILDDNRARVIELLKSQPELTTQLIDKPQLHESKILHWLYAEDTALHLAAAGYRVEIAYALIKAGADVNAARNHRQGRPLHYAADGCPGNPIYNPTRQVKMIQTLVKAGAEVNAADKNGATALHRAVRTRCAPAVECLLKHGGDPTLKNKPGSTPFHLAVQNTGRGGSGNDDAKASQREIIKLLLNFGASPELKDARDKSVRDWARDPELARLLQ